MTLPVASGDGPSRAGRRPQDARPFPRRWSDVSVPSRPSESAHFTLALQVARALRLHADLPGARVRQRFGARSARRSRPRPPRSCGGKTRSSRCEAVSCASHATGAACRPRARRADRGHARRQRLRSLGTSLSAVDDPQLRGRRAPMAHPSARARFGLSRAAPLRRAALIDRMHADGLAGSTIRNKIEPLRVLYRRAVQDEEVTTNPTTHLRLPALATSAPTHRRSRRAASLLDALPDSERALWASAFYAGSAHRRATRAAVAQRRLRRRSDPRRRRLGRLRRRARHEDAAG